MSNHITPTVVNLEVAKGITTAAYSIYIFNENAVVIFYIKEYPEYEIFFNDRIISSEEFSEIIKDAIKRDKSNKPGEK